MKTIKIKVDDTGLNGQAVNPFTKAILDTDEDDRLVKTIANPEYQEFKIANPPFPLTAPSIPNQIVDAVLVDQMEQYCGTVKWQTIKGDVENFKKHDGRGTWRKAFEVVVNKEETPEPDWNDRDSTNSDTYDYSTDTEATEQSAVDAAIVHFTGSGVEPSIRELFISGVKFGVNHILKDLKMKKA